MTEDERKARQEFQRKIFLLQKSVNDLQENFAKVNKEMNELWLKNDEILNGDNK